MQKTKVKTFTGKVNISGLCCTLCFTTAQEVVSEGLQLIQYLPCKLEATTTISMSMAANCET